MGCKWCSSGLGRNCAGPLGLDDLEVGCSCSCHECEECGSAYCECVGGPDPCESERDIEPIFHEVDMGREDNTITQKFIKDFKQED